MNDYFEDDGFFDDEPVDNTSKPVNSEEVDFLELVHRALDSKHSNFEFLRSAQDRTSAKIVRFSYATVSKMFKKLYESTYKTYLKQVEFGEQDVETLMALKQFKHCMEFYDDEAKIVDDMLEEYTECILSGHVIDTLLGKVRPDEDLHDYRGRGKNGK
jgi:negative regulator of genetic competence, sporulation and motility